MMMMNMSSSRIRRVSKHSPAGPAATALRSDNDDAGEAMNVDYPKNGADEVASGGGMGIGGGVGGSGSGGGSMSGIDSFLHRLNNDADLNNASNNSSNSKLSRIKKKKHQQHQRLLSNSKTSNIHEDSSSTDHAQTASATSCSSTITSCSTLQSSQPTNKRLILLSLLSIPLLYLLYDTMISPPHQRILHHYFHLITPTSTSTTTTAMIHSFLSWVQHHPTIGAIAFIFAYGLCVILLLPGTPLTLGGGYVYKVSYGWVGGITMATFTTIAGSLFGSCTCFLLGRYILRSRIRIWGRKKYPFFDAMDGAISENGFKIMCLLYLTPILPLGPVSYMVGTTSMSIGKFAGAKVAAVPIVIMYCFIGASTDTFFGNGDVVVAVENDSLGLPRMMDEVGGGSIDGVGGEGGSMSSGEGEGGIGVSKSIVNGMVGGGGGAAAVGGGVVDESTHRKMVLFGLILSFVSMSLVSHFVKKELYKIFDKQKRDKSDDGDEDGDGRGGTISSSSATTVNNNIAMEDHIEMGSGVDRKNLLRRPRGGHDEEKG